VTIVAGRGVGSGGLWLRHPLPRLRRVLPRLRGGEFGCHPLPRLRRVLPRLRGESLVVTPSPGFAGYSPDLAGESLARSGRTQKPPSAKPIARTPRARLSRPRGFSQPLDHASSPHCHALNAATNRR